MTQMCRVLYLYAFGFPVAWERSIIPKKHCDVRSQKKAHVKVKGEQPSIKLTELSGAFLVLGVGLSFAFLVFLIEKIVAVWKETTDTIVRPVAVANDKGGLTDPLSPDVKPPSDDDTMVVYDLPD